MKGLTNIFEKGFPKQVSITLPVVYDVVDEGVIDGGGLPVFGVYDCVDEGVIDGGGLPVFGVYDCVDEGVIDGGGLSDDCRDSFRVWRQDVCIPAKMKPENYHHTVPEPENYHHTVPEWTKRKMN